LTLVLSGIAVLGGLLVAIPAFKTSLVHNGSS
jgi:hypothetical protein